MDTEEIFGPDAAGHIQVLERLSGQLRGHKYEFMPPAEYLSTLARDVRVAQEIYWREMLYRAHFCASASLLRSHAWLSGIQLAARAGNVHVFAASFRGFIEAAADTNDALNPVPPTLAEYASLIEVALAGSQATLHLCGDLENRLIHFSHARKLQPGEAVPDSHRAKLTTKYLESFDSPQRLKIASRYGWLCQVTHPAAHSVLCYSRWSDDETLGELDPDTGPELIRGFCESSRDVIPTLMALGVMPALYTLRVLNELPLDPLHTPAVNGFGLERLPAWPMLEARLAESHARSRQ